MLRRIKQRKENKYKSSSVLCRRLRLQSLNDILCNFLNLSIDSILILSKNNIQHREMSQRVTERKCSNNIHEKKILNSDWLRAVQCSAVPKGLVQLELFEKLTRAN